MTAEYICVAVPKEYEAAAILFREYAAWLKIDLGFQKFEEELLDLKTMYRPPLGNIILCKIQEQYVGSIAYRKFATGIAELKRMYVKPAFQGTGIGKNLLKDALLLARQSGYKTIRLDTLNNMIPAITLYKSNGFIEIPPYYHNPEPTAAFFQKQL